MLACGTFTTGDSAESVQVGTTEQPESHAFPTSTPIVIATPSAAVDGSGNEQGLGGGTGFQDNLGLAIANSNVSLIVGERALVLTGNGINVREFSSTSADEVGKLSQGAIVEVLEGPFANENLFWWRVKTVDGLYEGMVAEGLDGEEYLAPAANVLVPVDRDPIVDDIVRVTNSLNLRRDPGVSSSLLQTLESGQEFQVIEGPIHQGGYDWYKVRNESGTLIGWSVSTIGGTRTLVPLE